MKVKCLTEESTKKLIHKVMKRDDAENRIILTLSLFLESNSLIVQSSLNHLCAQQNKLKFFARVSSPINEFTYSASDITGLYIL